MQIDGIGARHGLIKEQPGTRAEGGDDDGSWQAMSSRIRGIEAASGEAGRIDGSGEADLGPKRDANLRCSVGGAHLFNREGYRGWQTQADLGGGDVAGGIGGRQGELVIPRGNRSQTERFIKGAG